MKEFLLHWQNKDQSFCFGWYITEERLLIEVKKIKEMNGNILFAGQVKCIKEFE